MTNLHFSEEMTNLQFSEEEMMKFVKELYVFFEDRNIPASHATIVMAEVLAVMFKERFAPEYQEMMADSFKKLLMNAINGLEKNEEKRVN